MSYIGNQPISAAFLTDTFSGNGSTVAFTMSVAPANTSSVIVAITGVLQDPSTYSVAGTTLTFSAAPPSGTNNISVRYLGIPASGVTTTAYRTVTNFTATAGQTTFSTPSYTVGYIDVYRNGVRLAAADYTATNGTTVVLASAASAGDSVVTESFYVSSVLNAIPATAGSIGQTYLAGNVGATGPAFYAWANVTNTSITNNTWTKVILNAELFDTNSNFDSTTNYRFTPSIAGYYQVSASVFSNYSGTQFTQWRTSIYKNGSAYSTQDNAPTSMYGSYSCNTLVYLNGTTDYIELYVYANGGTSPTYSFATPTSANTYMTGFLARAA